MSNLPLKALLWESAKYSGGAANDAQGAGIYYRAIQRDEKHIVYWVDSMGGSDGDKSFDSLDELKEWVETTHYPHKMQTYVVPTTLADAVRLLVDACHGASVKGGWWHDLATGEPLQRNKLEMIALIHSEVSEAVEGIRKGINDDHLPNYPMEDVEMADTLIRIFDYIGGHKLKTADALVDKLDYNANRADHKPENRAKAGGKKC